MTPRMKVIASLVVCAGIISCVVGCGGGTDATLTEAPVVSTSTTGGIPSLPVFDPLPSPVPLITPTPSPTPSPAGM